MIKNFTFILLAATLNCAAQTSIPAGNVSGTWTTSGSPYNIQGDIQIPNDSTLSIEPGVKVVFQGAYKLLIKGRLLAVGTVTDSITFIPSNTSTGWKGIHFQNTATTNDSSKFFYCILQYAKSNGALFFQSFSKAIISSCLISYNTSNSGGGGIALNGSNPTVINCKISNNTASTSGGGISCYNSNPFLINNIITNNTSNGTTTNCEGGGGIYCYNSNPTIFNNTISKNKKSGYGGAVLCELSNPILYNTIIWGNSTPQVSLVGGSADPDFYFCDIQGGSSAFGFACAGGIYNGIYINNLDTNPVFVSPSGGIGNNFDGVSADWSLQCTSSCINSGDSVGSYPSTDIAGNSRIADGSIDIGAYEYQTFVTLSNTLNFCQGDSVILTANSAISYLWNTGATAQSIVVSLTGNYSVTTTDSTGCSAGSSLIPVQVDSFPVALINISGSIPFCQGDSVELISNSANSYLWSNGEVTQSISVFQSGSYSVIITNSCGIDTSSSIETSVLPNVSFTQTLTVNSGDSVQVGSSIYTTSGTYLDTIIAVNGCDSIITTNLTVLTGIKEISDKEIGNIFPNPGKGNFILQLNREELGSVLLRIYNIFGVNIYSAQIKEERTLIDLVNQEDGIYLFQLLDGNDMFIRRIVITK